MGNAPPRTACTMPSAVRNDTCRSSTSSSATLPTLPGARARTPKAPVVHSMPSEMPSESELYSQLAPRDRDRGAPTGTATCRLSASGLAQPDVRHVEPLDPRYVDGVVHVAGVIQRLQRLRDRVDRRVLRDLLVDLR